MVRSNLVTWNSYTIEVLNILKEARYDKDLLNFLYINDFEMRSLTFRPQSNFNPGMQAACTKDPFATKRISNKSSANAII